MYLSNLFIIILKFAFLISGKPLNVFIGFQVLDIGEVNEETMVNYYYSIELFFATELVSQKFLC